MKRPAAAENTLERIAAWRRVVPDITIRSTFIVGFPGETDEDFEELLDWMRVAQLDRVGCFEYSPVEGAAANDAARAAPVPAEVKAERRARFMELAAEISAQRLQQKSRPQDAGSRSIASTAMSPSRAPRAMRRRSTARCASRVPAQPKPWPWAPCSTCRSPRRATMISRRRLIDYSLRIGTASRDRGNFCR